MENLPPGALRFTALLTPQGRLLHDLFVYAGETDAILDVPAAARDALLKRLSPSTSSAPRSPSSPSKATSTHCGSPQNPLPAMRGEGRVRGLSASPHYPTMR
jgi:glycine cleavage system aminomethyltransferase T